MKACGGGTDGVGEREPAREGDTNTERVDAITRASLRFGACVSGTFGEPAHVEDETRAFDADGDLMLGCGTQRDIGEGDPKVGASVARKVGGDW